MLGHLLLASGRQPHGVMPANRCCMLPSWLPSSPAARRHTSAAYTHQAVAHITVNHCKSMRPWPANMAPTPAPAAPQAAPFLGPIDKEVLRDVLKALKSPTFQAGGSLLAALGCSDVEQHQYLGLLKVGASCRRRRLSHSLAVACRWPARPTAAARASCAIHTCKGHDERSWATLSMRLQAMIPSLIQPHSRCHHTHHHHHTPAVLQSGPSAFTPYTSHLIGQPASGSSSGSGMLGCLAHKEWTVRRAAADALKVAAALLGPHLEPDGCWDRSEPRSVCGRACKALEACKFDKVGEEGGVLLLYSSLRSTGQAGVGTTLCSAVIA